MGYVKYNLNLTIYGLPLRPNGVGGSILKKAKDMREDPRCKQKPFTFFIGRKKVKTILNKYVNSIMCIYIEMFRNTNFIGVLGKKQ